MDFEFTEREEQLRADFRAWLEANLPDGWGSPSFDLAEHYASEEEFLRAWQRQLYEAGWAGVSWPVEYGGRGFTAMEHAIVWEEKERYEAPRELNDVGLQFVGYMLMREGSAEQCDRYLRPMLTGDEVWAQGFSEPEAGSDLASLRTRAVRAGDDYVVNGAKIWTSNANAADLILLLVRTDPTAAKHAGLSVLIVDAKSPGITISPIQQIDGRHEFNSLFLDDVHIPVGNLIGAEGDGWRVAIGTLEPERMASTYAFAMRRRVARLIMNCRESYPQARGDQVDQDEAASVWSELADFAVEAHAARLTYYRGVSRLARGGTFGVEWSASKLHTSEMAKRTMGFAASSFGVAGVSGATERPVGYEPLAWGVEYLHSLCRTIGAGTSQIQRDIIARRILGLPRG